MRGISTYDEWADAVHEAEKRKVDYVPNTAAEELDWIRLRVWAKEQGDDKMVGLVDRAERSEKDSRTIISAHLDRTYAVAESATPGEPINEATYVGKKHQMILDAMRADVLQAMVDNIRSSPDYESTRRDSEVAIGILVSAYTRFCMETKKAMEKIGTNYAGV